MCFVSNTGRKHNFCLLTIKLHWAPLRESTSELADAVYVCPFDTLFSLPLSLDFVMVTNYLK